MSKVQDFSLLNKYKNLPPHYAKTENTFKCLDEIYEKDNLFYEKYYRIGAGGRQVEPLEKENDSPQDSYRYEWKLRAKYTHLDYPTLISFSRWEQQLNWRKQDLGYSKYRESGHRDNNLPASIGYEMKWVKYGRLHNEEGPAILSSNDVNTPEYWINSIRVSKEQHGLIKDLRKEGFSLEIAILCTLTHMEPKKLAGMDLPLDWLVKAWGVEDNYVTKALFDFREDRKRFETF